MALLAVAVENRAARGTCSANFERGCKTSVLNISCKVDRCELLLSSSSLFFFSFVLLSSSSSFCVYAKYIYEINKLFYSLFLSNYNKYLRAFACVKEFAILVQRQMFFFANAISTNPMHKKKYIFIYIHLRRYIIHQFRPEKHKFR